MTRSIHFPPRDTAAPNGIRLDPADVLGVKKARDPKQICEPVAKNSYETSRKPTRWPEAFRDVYRDAELVREKVKGLISSENRHGDLQVIKSAAQRIVENALLMIDIEQL